MKRVLALSLTIILATTLLAKENVEKRRRDFATIKKAKIAKLEERLETIKKRLLCIKEAKSSKEIKQCEKKYKLVKRKKRVSGAKK